MSKLVQVTKRLQSISARPLLFALLILGATIVGSGIAKPAVGHAFTIDPLAKKANWIGAMQWTGCGPLNSDTAMPPTLRKGSTNRNCVIVLQHFLNNWNQPNYGRPLVEDGVFGSATERQVKDFQNYARWFSLSSGPTDGIVGTQTWSAIFNNCMDTNLQPICSRV